LSVADRKRYFATVIMLSRALGDCEMLRRARSEHMDLPDAGLLLAEEEMPQSQQPRMARTRRRR
jgi:hypothetical protein